MTKDLQLKELTEFLAIQSVSTDPLRKKEMARACEYLVEKLESFGCDVKIFTHKGVPSLVIARLDAQIKNIQTKTLGIYGHYDVQPEDPIEEWGSEPFVLTIKNGKMYARGIADDKGHIMQNLFAIEALVKEGKLNNNIVFIFEGEEETGSAHFEAYMEESKDVLKDVDCFYITDMGMHEKNVPQIFYALRGILYFELRVKTVKRDLHSGIYGNIVLNPAQVIASLMTKMKDVETGEILIPNIYDSVRKPDAEELALLNKTIRDDRDLKDETGAEKLMSIRGIPPSLVSKLLPSLDINGMQSGYTAKGSKTIIPKEAMVKFSIRLVEKQDPHEIERIVREFIVQEMAKGASFDLDTFACEAPFYTSLDNSFVTKSAEIMRDIFGNSTLFNRSGGSVPAAEILQKLYGKPVILTGFTLPDDNIHSPNENFDEEMFWKGIEALKAMYSA
jgi:acetylornithine deacetylase/succinyl-diaminopimelate desuccinylase-like protein